MPTVIKKLPKTVKGKCCRKRSVWKI